MLVDYIGFKATLALEFFISPGVEGCEYGGEGRICFSVEESAWYRGYGRVEAVMCQGIPESWDYQIRGSHFIGMGLVKVSKGIVACGGCIIGIGIFKLQGTIRYIHDCLSDVMVCTPRKAAEDVSNLRGSVLYLSTLFLLLQQSLLD